MFIQKIKGFTIVELIIVLIIVMTVMAYAVPKYMRLTIDARRSAVISIAGALSASNAMNYSIRATNRKHGIPITNCDNLSSLLAGGLPSSYVITPAQVPPGASVVCTLADSPKSGEKMLASFYAFGIV